MLHGLKLRKIYHAGYCIGRGELAQKGSGWAKRRFHARAFLLEHPQKGLILIDTGYGQSLLDATKKGLGRIYQMLLKVVYDPNESLSHQLAHDGIGLNDLSYLIVTHFHPDHIGALPEFSTVPWIYREESLMKSLSLSRWQGLKKGFFHQLVPAIPKGSLAIRESDFKAEWHGFPSLSLSEMSLTLVDLPGHALGQMGVAFEKKLVAADAVISLDALPNWLGMCSQEDRQMYKKTHTKLKELSHFIEIFPTHTMEAHE